MFTKKIAVVMALAYAAAAQDDCQNTYNSCVAAGTPEIVCNCNLTACLGEDNARNREFCATATAGLATQTTAAPSSTSNGIPGGCNPAHLGSCPTSTTAVNSIPGGCNPAHPGSCPTSTAVVNSIPGGCNPAHPGSCPSSYFTAKTFTTVYVTPTASSVAAPTPTASTPESGAGWTVENLSRYCGESDTGCDYNFKINKNDGSPSTACTIIRLGVSNASTESWYDLPCSSDAQGIRVSWGYATNPAPPFAVMTIVNQPLKKMAYFGVSNVNEQPVTASNPKGSGTYGNIGPQPLYAF